ncbi:hypothetical protein PoB_001048000, partial [Plakobranchus ocellatus]
TEGFVDIKTEKYCSSASAQYGHSQKRLTKVLSIPLQLSSPNYSKEVAMRSNAPAGSAADIFIFLRHLGRRCAGFPKAPHFRSLDSSLQPLRNRTKLHAKRIGKLL